MMGPDEKAEERRETLEVFEEPTMKCWTTLRRQINLESCQVDIEVEYETNLSGVTVDSFTSYIKSFESDGLPVELVIEEIYEDFSDMFFHGSPQGRLYIVARCDNDKTVRKGSIDRT